MPELYDPWSTHLPALALAVHRYGPRVLEIGCGWYSTPLLHTMSTQVITLEVDERWASKFERIVVNPIQIAPDIVAAARAFSVHDWDVVFVDCEPVPARGPCVEIFLDHPCCIVAHDTEAAPYPELLKRVRYQKHFDFIMPRTSFLSNVKDVEA